MSTNPQFVATCLLGLALLGSLIGLALSMSKDEPGVKGAWGGFGGASSGWSITPSFAWLGITGLLAISLTVASAHRTEDQKAKDAHPPSSCGPTAANTVVVTQDAASGAPLLNGTGSAGAAKSKAGSQSKSSQTKKSEAPCRDTKPNANSQSHKGGSADATGCQ